MADAYSWGERSRLKSGDRIPIWEVLRPVLSPRMFFYTND